MNPFSWLRIGRKAGLQVFLEDGDRGLCRGRLDSGARDRNAVLVVLPATDFSTAAASLDRLTHECGLKDESDEGWTARPLSLWRERSALF
jgi:hypothetical protein